MGDGAQLSIKIAVLGWLVTSVILGVIYILFEMPSQEMLTPILTMLIFPIISISWFVIRDKMLRADVARRDKIVIQTTNKCRDWAQKFPFLNNEMIEIKIYLSNGTATGRLIIQDVNQVQAQELKDEEDTLPKNIHLVVIAKEYENNEHYQ